MKKMENDQNENKGGEPSTLSLAESMEKLKSIEFEGKDAIIGGIQAGLSEKNEEAKTNRIEMQGFKSTLDSFTEKLSEATGAKIDPRSDIDVKSVISEISSLKEKVTSFDTKLSEANEEAKTAKINAEVTKSIAGKVTEESKEDALELLRNKFTMNSSNEIVSKDDGVKLGDYIEGFLDKRPTMKRQNASTGAGLRKSSTDAVDTNSAQGKVQAKLNQLRAGRA